MITHNATHAIITPGAAAYPLLVTNRWATKGVSPPKRAVAVVAPNARPLSLPSPGNCSAVVTAPTALTAPPRAAKTIAPTQVAVPPPAIAAKMPDGSIMPPTASVSNMGRRPKRSDASPIIGVTKTTVSAATTEIDSARVSGMVPVASRNVGT